MYSISFRTAGGVATLILAAATLLPSPIAAQGNPDPISTITEAELRDHIFYLASDFLEGRDAGTRGFELAAQYAASQLAQAGLQTMYADSAGIPSFFQQINFVRTAISPETSIRIEVAGSEHAYSFGEHFIAQQILGGGRDRSVTESPVFLGYGIEEPELGWNDYEGVEVAGKIAVVVAGAPTRNGQPVLPPEQHQRYSNLQRSASTLFQSALNHEITTLIVVLDPGSAGLWEMAVRQSTAPSVRPEEVGEEESAPATALSEFVLMRPEAAVELLAGTGLDPLTGTGTYRPGPMDGVNLTFDLRHTVEPGFTTPNVVGLLPGSDPALKDEYIVVTAHLDHVGVRNGQVYNGADDNASGSAAVMEAAEAVAMAEVRRSVIFVLLTAEEKGLLGAFHFARNPPVPVEKIVLNINLDMVGRNSPEFPEALLALASEEGKADLVGMIREVNETRVGATLDWRLIEGEDPHGHVQRSDQLAFMQEGIPAILITRGFMGPDYHEPSDDPETINYDKVLQAAQLTFGLAVKAANREERPGSPGRSTPPPSSGWAP